MELGPELVQMLTQQQMLAYAASFPRFHLGLQLCKEGLFPIVPVPILSTMALKLQVGDPNSL